MVQGDLWITPQAKLLIGRDRWGRLEEMVLVQWSRHDQHTWVERKDIYTWGIDNYTWHSTGHSNRFQLINTHYPVEFPQVGDYNLWARVERCGLGPERLEGLYEIYSNLEQELIGVLETVLQPPTTIFKNLAGEGVQYMLKRLATVAGLIYQAGGEIVINHVFNGILGWVARHLQSDMAKAAIAQEWTIDINRGQVVVCLLANDYTVLQRTEMHGLSVEVDGGLTHDISLVLAVHRDRVDVSGAALEIDKQPINVTRWELQTVREGFWVAASFPRLMVQLQGLPAISWHYDSQHRMIARVGMVNYLRQVASALRLMNEMRSSNENREVWAARIMNTLGLRFMSMPMPGFTPFAPPEPSPTPQQQIPACCNGCTNLFGRRHEGRLFVCAMHPYGYDGELCPDHSNANQNQSNPAEPGDRSGL